MGSMQRLAALFELTRAEQVYGPESHTLLYS